MRLLTRLRRNVRAVSASALLGVIVALAVGGLIVAFIGPPAILAISNVTTTDWNTDAISIWNVLPIMLTLGFVLAIITFAVKGAD